MTAPATLPALRHLGDLADLRPCIVVDTREQAPLPIRHLPMVRGTLQTGDYSGRGLEEHLAVERKSIPDLVGCCIGENRERFERELHRLRGYRWKRLLIVGTREAVLRHEYRSNILPKVVLHSLSAWEARFECPVVWEPTPEAAALRVEGWVFWAAREVVQDANDLFRGVRHE